MNSVLLCWVMYFLESKLSYTHTLTKNAYGIFILSGREREKHVKTFQVKSLTNNMFNRDLV